MSEKLVHIEEQDLIFAVHEMAFDDHAAVAPIVLVARSVLIFLSAGILRSIALLKLIAEAEEGAVADAVGAKATVILPITLPGFTFPDSSFYESALLTVVHRSNAGKVADLVRTFFMRIARPLSIHASDHILATEVTGFANQVPVSAPSKIPSASRVDDWFIAVAADPATPPEKTEDEGTEKSL